MGSLYASPGYAVAQMIKALCYTTEKCWFESW
jgi:hypothetical protein